MFVNFFHFNYHVYLLLHFSVVVIGIASGCSLDVLNKLLETVFSCTVLIVGRDELKMQRNVEKIKRELRVV